MEIIIKIDGSDSRQFIDAATKFAGAVQSFKPEDILDKVADVLGFLAADGNKDGASSDAPAAENVRVAPDNDGSHFEPSEPKTDSDERYIGSIKVGDVSLATFNALNNAGIKSVYMLAEYTKGQLMRLEGMDAVGIKECRILLAKRDLALRGDEA